MKQTNRRAADDAPRRPGPTIVETLLRDVIVDAAAVGQVRWGRGVLLVRYDSASITWIYRPFDECAEEMSEWAELEGLLSLYDPDCEVLVGFLGEGFFRLPLLHR